MIQKKTVFMLGYLFLAISTAYAQNVNYLYIDSAYALARANYPLVKQYALIEKAKAYSLENANKGYFPQFNIVGQATNQSEVTEIPVKLPNINITPLSKNQFKLYGEVSQPLTDLLLVDEQKDLINSNAEIDAQKIQIELYKLKERVNNLFFGILLIDAQMKQTELLKKDIQNAIDKTNTAVENGIAIKSNVDNLSAELLKANQRSIELKSNKKAYTDMLSLLMNRSINENTVLQKPYPVQISNTINRPEIKLFDLQKKTFDVQSKLLTAKNLPRLSLYFQGGLGRPALNMLSNDVKGYYIGGLRLNWNFSGLYTYSNEKKLLAINQNILDVQKNVFLFNTNMNLQQQNAEVVKVLELIEIDKSIISLRENIKITANTQLEFGTISSNDFLVALNAQDQAQQNLLMHQIQLIMTQYTVQTTTGN